MSRVLLRVRVALAGWVHQLRWGEWYRICDESAAERWRLIESAPPGPERDRMLRLHAAIAGIYAAHDPRDPTGDGRQE